MIDILDELTEIPFEVFWDKYQEIRPGKYDVLKTKAVWFSMFEDNRIMAFECLAKNHQGIQMFHSPYEYLEYFNLPI
jgi:hypothetical protein